jgi:hypothetical protein
MLFKNSPSVHPLKFKQFYNLTKKTKQVEIDIVSRLKKISSKNTKFHSHLKLSNFTGNERTFIFSLPRNFTQSSLRSPRNKKLRFCDSHFKMNRHIALKRLKNSNIVSASCNRFRIPNFIAKATEKALLKKSLEKDKYH